MVIAPGRDGVVAYIMLHDGEKISPKWNIERSVIYLVDRGTILKTIKQAGDILPRDSKYLLTVSDLCDTFVHGERENKNDDPVEDSPANGGV